MGLSIYDSTTLLNTISDGDINPDSYAQLSAAQQLPLLRIVETGRGLQKTETSDYTRWGLGFATMEGATYGTQYRGAMQRSTPRAGKKLALRLSKHENSGEAYDVDEISSHRATTTQFTDFLKSIQDQNNLDIAYYTERKLMGVPQDTSDEYGVHGVMTWLQPKRNSSAVIQANTTGGFNGDRVLYADGTTHSTTLAEVDRSADAYAKYRNYNHSIGTEIDDDTILAIRKALRVTGFNKLSFASERVSTGNLKNIASQDPHEYVNRQETGNRLLCGPTDFDALNTFVEMNASDDSTGDALKFGKKKVVGLTTEYTPLLDSTHELYMDGEGTIYPTSPMYLVNWSKWLLCKNGEMWKPGPYMPDPQNPTYQVIRQRRFTFNLRPKNDLRMAGACFYRV